MNRFPESELRIWLRLQPAPLVKIEETEHEWWLGNLSLNKVHPNWRSGHGHPLRRESTFYKQWFDLNDQQRGWAVVFRPIDPLPPEVEDHFVGWVSPHREPEVDRWIGFLNNEISMRLGNADDPNAPRSPNDDPAIKSDFEREMEHEERLSRISPSKLVK